MNAMPPVYHRLQTGPALRLIAQSGELWGQPAQNIFRSDIPKVKAYLGPLPEGASGVEFTADVAPDPGSVPGKPTWSGPRPGVEVEGDFARIKITVLKIVPPPEP